MMKIFAALISLVPVVLLYKMTKYSLDNYWDNAAIGFGMGFVFSILGYFLIIFNLFGVAPF